MSPTDPGTVAQRQLEAYNAQDAEAFALCYAPEVEVFDLGSATPTLAGREALRERYARLFAAHPRQRCRLLHRIVAGRFVVDHEEITGREGQARFEAVALDETDGPTIRRVWFLPR